MSRRISGGSWSTMTGFVEDDSAQLSQPATIGSRAAEPLQELTKIDLSKVPYYHDEGELAGEG
jgi:hypothetical protein